MIGTSTKKRIKTYIQDRGSDFPESDRPKTLRVKSDYDHTERSVCYDIRRQDSMKKKMLSVLLILCVMISLCPAVNVNAAEGDTILSEVRITSLPDQYVKTDSTISIVKKDGAAASAGDVVIAGADTAGYVVADLRGVSAFNPMSGEFVEEYILLRPKAGCVFTTESVIEVNGLDAYARVSRLLSSQGDLDELKTAAGETYPAKIGDFLIKISPAEYLHTHDMGTEATDDDVTFAKRITSEADLTALFSEGGSGYLMNDLVLSNTASVQQNKNVSLCLNDHTITTAADVTGPILFVDQHTSLLLTDCGTTVRYFTDEDDDGAYETLHDDSFDLTGKTPGTTYIRTEGGVLYGGRNAQDGGAIDLSGYSELTLAGISLVGNHSESNGGALSAVSDVTITKCLLAGNSCKYSGGAIFCHDISLEGSELSYNTAHTEGGAIYSLATSDLNISQTNMIGNRVLNVTESETESTASGGALSVYNQNVDLTDCVIRDNYVYSKYGKAQFAAMVTSALTMKNTTISGNTAEGKEAFAIIQSRATTVEACEISGNRLIGSTSAEALMILVSGESLIKNSALKNNTAVCEGDAVAMAGLKKTDAFSSATLALSGDIIFSGNTFCDISSITSLDLSALTSVKDADGADTTIAYYYSKYLDEGD